MTGTDIHGGRRIDMDGVCIAIRIAARIDTGLR